MSAFRESGIAPEDDSKKQSQVVQPPSETSAPTVQDAPQQASTSPGDGPTVPADQAPDPNDLNFNVVNVPARKLSFKEQVFGYAKVTRGQVLGKPDVKETGEKILRGEATIDSSTRKATRD